VNNRSGECGKERQHECIASPVEGFRCGGSPKSFTRAAAELGLTQSAISRSVRELEEEIDQRLFDRTTRQVELTDAGEMLSQRICHLIEEVEQTLRDSHGTGKPCGHGADRHRSGVVIDDAADVGGWLPQGVARHRHHAARPLA
jgi:DNA-binding transcriptional LysR family regulator